MLKDHIHRIWNCMQHACNFTMPFHIHEPILCMFFPPYTQRLLPLLHILNIYNCILPWAQCTWRPTKSSSSQPARLWRWTLTHMAIIGELVGGTPSWPTHGTTPLEPICNRTSPIMVSKWSPPTFVLFLHRVHKLLQIQHLHRIQFLSL